MDEVRVDILVPCALVEEPHRRAQHQRKAEENDNECPQDISVGHDTKSKPCKWLSLKLGLVLNVVLLLFLMLLFHFLAVDHHCSLFLEQRVFGFRIKTVILFFLYVFTILGVVGYTALCKDAEP